MKNGPGGPVLVYCLVGAGARRQRHLVHSRNTVEPRCKARWQSKVLVSIRHGEALEIVKAGPLLIKCLSLLGMPLADRSRVSAAAPHGLVDNPDKEFFG